MELSCLCTRKSSSCSRADLWEHFMCTQSLTTSVVKPFDIDTLLSVPSGSGTCTAISWYQAMLPNDSYSHVESLTSRLVFLPMLNPAFFQRYLVSFAGTSSRVLQRHVNTVRRLLHLHFETTYLENGLSLASHSDSVWTSPRYVIRSW